MDPRDGRLLIRPMTPADVAACEEVSAEAFLSADRASRRLADPEPARRPPVRAAQWQERTAHFLTTDPGGGWVAEHRGEVIGFASSLRRELLWILASYAVRPGAQGSGIGRALLDAALTHARGCLRGMLAASDDPRAYRRYRLAGFSLHPQLRLEGVVDRSALPVVEHVREGTPGDVDLMDSLDRQLREAAHGPDHALLARFFRLLVTDTTTGTGYAYVDESGAPALLAASNRRTATRLLWECLAAAPADRAVAVRHVTAANEWAVDVALAARLEVRTEGHLGVRGMRPPTPYLHHGSFL